MSHDDCALCAQAAAIWADAARLAAEDTPGRHFTDAEENAIDRHLDACACGPGDVAHETATTPGRSGAITVTGYCEHDRAVTRYADSVL